MTTLRSSRNRDAFFMGLVKKSAGFCSVLAGLIEEAEDLRRVAIPIEWVAIRVGRDVDVDGVGGVVVDRRHS